MLLTLSLVGTRIQVTYLLSIISEILQRKVNFWIGKHKAQGIGCYPFSIVENNYQMARCQGNAFVSIPAARWLVSRMQRMRSQWSNSFLLNVNALSCKRYRNGINLAHAPSMLSEQRNMSIRTFLYLPTNQR